MLTASCRRTTVLLLLAVILAAPWAAAAVPRTEGGPQTVQAVKPADLLGRLWSFLREAWTKTGCEVDPNGRCLSGPAQPAAKEGCEVDPNGRCLH